jgi:hypothetical protein
VTWFKVDDDIAFHRKTVKAGNAAMGLWLRAGGWCAQQLTDGFVPDDMAALMGTPAQARKLVEATLWVEEPGGYRFHEWADRQPSAKKVREERARNAERQARHRRRNRPADSLAMTNNSATAGISTGDREDPDTLFEPDAQVSRPRNAVTNAGGNAGSDRGSADAPTRPDKYRTPNGVLPAAAGEHAAGAVEPVDEIKTAQKITASYVKRVPMSKYPAVLGITRRALRAGHPADSVEAALLRLADEGRPVTVDVLRVELEGLPPPRDGHGVVAYLPGAGLRPSTTDQRFAAAMALAASYPEEA